MLKQNYRQRLKMMEKKKTENVLKAKSEDKFEHFCLIVDEFQPLTPIAGIKTFQLDFSQFLTIIETSYAMACRVDRGLPKFISLSMYTYYCVTIFWQRILQILANRGKMMNESLAIMQKLKAYKLLCPKDVEMYLAGIGDFYDSDGIRAELKLAGTLKTIQDYTIDGAQGSFGRVDNHTHILYETMPAPIVCLLRIQADIKKTENPDVDSRWDLPDILAPNQLGLAEDKKLFPNANLLGWMPAVSLTNEQMMTLMASDISRSSFGSIDNVGGVPLNIDLLASISLTLGSAKQPISTEPRTNLRGSEAQSLSLEVAKDDRDFKMRANCASRSARVNSSHQTSIGVVSATGCFRFRIERLLETSDIYPFCYLINDEEAPNNHWITNENSVYHSCPRSWNDRSFSGTFRNGFSAAAAASSKVLEW